MTIMDKQLENKLRQGFKYYLNPFMISIWRLGLGKWLSAWPDVCGQFIVITHTGRKTGIRRRTPVNFGIVDGEIYCTAGFGAVSDWYRNMMVNPQIEVWTPDGWWNGIAEDVTGCPEHLRIMRQVLIGSGFAARMFGFPHPKTICEAELEELTSTYRLVHIRRIEARTGPEGPGDLAWVWPVATFTLLLALVSRRRR